MSINQTNIADSGVGCLALTGPLSVGPAVLQTVFDPKAGGFWDSAAAAAARRAARSWSAGNSNSEFAGQIGRTGPLRLEIRSVDREDLTFCDTLVLLGCHRMLKMR